MFTISDCMAELPLAPVRRILRNAGASRVSEEAAKAFAQSLEKFARDLTADAVKRAKKAGRTTVQRDDIREARSARR